MFKVSKLKDDFNLLYIQYCFSILPIDYAFDLRKLCFLNMQPQHFIPIVKSLYVVNGFAGLAELCVKYCIAVGHSRRPICCKCVCNVFLSRLSLCNLLCIYISISSFSLSVTLYCVNLRLIITIAAIAAPSAAQCSVV